MPERAVPPNQQPVGISFEDIDFIDSLFGAGAIGRNEHFIPPALDRDPEDALNVGQENGLNDQDAAGHPVAGLVAVDPPAAGNGAEEAPNERLQQMEQEDLQAVRNLLGRAIANNVITVSHCWSVLKNLREVLPKEGPYRIPRAQAEFARVLERLARVMTFPTEQDYGSAHCNHPLGYERLLQVLQETTPDDSCPFEYDECLDRLCKDMTAAASMMRGAEVVYVVKDRDEYASRLRSLAARLLRDV